MSDSAASVPAVGLGQDRRNDKTLGTFLGVFTPTLLTILGVIMYLRFGWMVGHLGLYRALGLVVLGNAITLITTFSFSAIATNTRVGVGGAYFIISRSLGLEVGGAIGIPLYLSQVFSVTLYAFGLAEAAQSLWPGLPVQGTAFAIVVLVGLLSFKGADIALRTQIPVLVAVVASILALTVGAVGSNQDLNVSTPTGDVGFWAVFAVFFPAVTGVMAGLGLSGDLKDPKKSIPRGALGGAITGFVTYLFIVVLLAMGANNETLLTSENVWADIAPLGKWLILPGMFGAIFSSAVGSILGAPRTLQALAADHAVPGGWLSRLIGPPDKEPIGGLVISLGIALAAIFLGGLNAVAEVVSMFFLTVYSIVNIVAALETLSGDHTWRPKLQVHWAVSLAGAAGCMGAMFLINATAATVAIAVEIMLWIGFQRMERNADWGDMRRDIYEALIRWALFRLRHRPMTARNWRPHVLVFANPVEKRIELARYGSWFSQDRGVVTVCEMRVGELMTTDVDVHKRQEEITAVLESEGLAAFPEVAIVPSTAEGIVQVVQANGMAGLQSNTILLGWPNIKKLGRLLGILRRLEKLNKSLIIARLRPRPTLLGGRRKPRIDIWWGGLQRNGDLMLLLAHLLTRNPQWRGAKLRVLSIASNEGTKADTEASIKKLLPEARIDAETRVILKPKDRAVVDIIKSESANSDVVFLGLGSPTEGDEEAYAERLATMVDGLPTVFFVKNASLFVGELMSY